jgi:hypothetical protein
VAANDTQHGGVHYKAMAIQPWDYIVANRLGYLEGNVVKYITRWREKGGLEDLMKAQHYLEKLIEVERARPDPPPPGLELVDEHADVHHCGAMPHIARET